MMRTTLIAALLAAPLLAPAPAAFAYTLFVANEDGGSISRIDTRTGGVSEVAAGLAPHNVDTARAGALVLASGVAGHGHHGGAGQLLVLRQGAEGLAVDRAVDVGGHPAHVVPDATGERAFLTDAQTNAVLVVDLQAGKVVRAIKVGAYPHGLRLSPDGAVLAVANMKGGSVSLVSLADFSVRTVAVGEKPVQVAFTPDGRTLWVSLNKAGRVAAVDVAAGTLRGTHKVGRGPVQLAVTADGGKLVVANQGSRAKPAQTVSVLDAQSGKPLATILSGKGAHGVTLSPDGRSAFVTNTYENTVSEIDLTTGKRARQFRVGAGPNGIALN